jgi:hypothetical protein
MFGQVVALKLLSILTMCILVCLFAPLVGYTSPPTVVSVIPVNETAGISVNTSITVQFDREMDTSTVDINLETSFGDDISGSLSFESIVHSNDTAIFTPNQALDYSLGYEVSVEGARDTSGNILLGHGNAFETIFFTEGAPGDTSSPNVISTYPFDGQNGWDWNQIIVIMDKPIDPSTVNPATLSLTGPGDTSYSIEYGSDMIQIIAIRTNNTLLPNSSYTLTMTTDLTDAEGHSLSQNYTWMFNTGSMDTTLPFVVQTKPENSATNHGAYHEVSVYFSENMDHSTIDSSTVTVYDLTTEMNQEVYMDDLDSEGSRTFVNLSPANQNNTWDIGHTYRVTLDSSISDAVGNSLGNDHTFQFTVANFGDSAPDIFLHDLIGVMRNDGTTAVELDVECDPNNTVVVQDLTQSGKQWNLTNDGDDHYIYETPDGADEGLQTGYHDLLVTATNNSNGQSRSLNWQLYVFNASPTLVAPASGTVVTTSTPTLSFSGTGVNNAALYIATLYDFLAEKVAFTTVLIETGQISYTLTIPESRALKPQTLYVWQVIVGDNHHWPMGEARSGAWALSTPNSFGFFSIPPILQLLLDNE